MVASVRQITQAIVAGLASHPKVKNPEVFEPIAEPGENPQEIFVQRWRNFDGLPLDAGLTVAVFPNSSEFEDGNARSSAEVSQKDMGRGLKLMTYNMILKLFYPAVGGIDSVKTIDYYVLDFPAYRGQKLAPLTPHGFNFMFPEGFDIKNGARALRAFNERVSQDYAQLIKQAQKQELQLEINPPEEILRDYLELFRVCVGDLVYLQNLGIRNPEVTALDFPTTKWSQEKNVYFHTAHLEFSFKAYPPNAQQLRTMNAIPTDTLAFSPEPNET
ncbi:MAG: hypothetical protein ABEK59_02820 [Halobacteria archaeon]